MYPGGKIYPIVGQLFEVLVLGLNGEELLKFARNNAMKYKKSYRFYYLGILHLSIIRAKEVEVTLFYHTQCRLILTNHFQSENHSRIQAHRKKQKLFFPTSFFGKRSACEWR